MKSRIPTALVEAIMPDLSEQTIKIAAGTLVIAVFVYFVWKMDSTYHEE
jgi:hypothetical protein